MRGKTPSIFVGAHIGFADRFLVMPSDVPRPGKILLKLGDSMSGSKYAPFVVSSDELESRLKILYNREEKSPFTQWTLNMGLHNKALRLLSHLEHGEFHPNGFDVSFPPSHSMSACSIILQGRRIFVRSAIWDKHYDRWRVRLTTINGRQHIPLNEFDDFDYVFVYVDSKVSSCGDQKGGFFLFSKKILIQTGAVQSTSGGRGVTSLTLWPPSLKPKCRSSIERQNWQMPYFFSIESGTDENLLAAGQCERFGNILKGLL